MDICVLHRLLIEASLEHLSPELSTSWNGGSKEKSASFSAPPTDDEAVSSRDKYAKDAKIIAQLSDYYQWATI